MLPLSAVITLFISIPFESIVISPSSLVTAFEITVFPASKITISPPLFVTPFRSSIPSVFTFVILILPEPVFSISDLITNLFVWLSPLYIEIPVFALIEELSPVINFQPGFKILTEPSTASIFEFKSKPAVSKTISPLLLIIES